MAAPKRVVSDSYGIDAEDWSDAIKALRRFDKQAGLEATRSIRSNAKPMLKRARVLMAASKGTHANISPAKSVRLSVTASKGAALRLVPVTGMEWAADVGMISGGMVPRFSGSSSFRHSTQYSRPYQGAGESFQRYRGFYGSQVTKGSIGFVMGRAIREGIRRFEKRVLDDLDDLMDRTMNRAGVPRTGGG